MRGLTIALFALAADRDLARARQVRPRAAFLGSSLGGIAGALNAHLLAAGAAARSCANHSLQELDDLAEELLGNADPRLDHVYRSAGDTRALRHLSAAGWAAETAAETGGLAALRAGKCAELVMVWTHHVPEVARARLLRAGLRVPLLSAEQHEGDLYAKQTTCSVCHRSDEAPVLAPRRADPAAAQPPVWPPRFRVDFVESTRQFATARAERGVFHNDYQKERMRWEHGAGQYNNWCECAGLPAEDAGAPCEILSVRTALDPAGAAYVLFRGLNKCCKLAGWDMGFSPIRPDWLTRPAPAQLLGTRREGNRTCSAWTNPNHGNPIMVGDTWSEDAEGLPCSYTDEFAWWSKRWESHNLTFLPDTYSTAEEPDEGFTIPEGMDCSPQCPNRHTWCFFTTGHVHVV